MRNHFSDLALFKSRLYSSNIFPRAEAEGRIFTEPYDTVNGSFVFPRTWPLTFRESSNINIHRPQNTTMSIYTFINRARFQPQCSWSVSVQNNLSATSLITRPANLATNWYQWDVHAEEANLTNPFVFRIVNAQGDLRERNTGGFYSTSWYIVQDNDASQSATSSSSAPTATGTSIEIALPPTTGSESVPSTAQGTLTEPTAPSSLTTGANTSGVGKVAIIGLTVGIVVVGAISIAVMWYLLRRRRRRKNRSGALSPVPLPDVPRHEQVAVQKQPQYQSVQEVYTQPSELQGLHSCYELPDKRYYH